MIGSGVKAQCKVCKGYAVADQFRLHPIHRQMVCPSCFTGKTEQKKKQAEETTKKPPGWDAEDEYLDRVARLRKMQETVTYTKIPGTDLVKCTCHHCKYVFKYDVARRSPRVCPYCDVEVPRIKPLM